MNDAHQNTNENEYIIIPNPIYDVVFRYLMEDADSAMIVISTLINEKIKKIHFEPLTHTQKQDPSEFLLQDPKTQDDVRLFHLDFTATVELPDGTEELIMIELQKASEPEDIFRFKRYISKNFQRKQKQEFTDPETQAIITLDRPIRLIPIFILNFRIENEINDLLIKTDSIKTGVFKNKKLEKHNEFVDNLIYNIWVVQLPNLDKIKIEEYKDDEYKTKLYLLLKLFDQKSKSIDNEHRLRIIRKIFPGFLDRIIKRLQSASIENPHLEELMFAEDEYLKSLVRRDNKIALLEEQLNKKDKALADKDKALEDNAKALKDNAKALEDKNKALEDKDKALEDNAKALEDKNKALEDKDKALEDKSKALEKEKNRAKELQLEFAKALKENGISIEVISNKTGLSASEIEQL
jgi:tetratricopeptide (TPR) repeat protein